MIKRRKVECSARTSHKSSFSIRYPSFERSRDNLPHNRTPSLDSVLRHWPGASDSYACRNRVRTTIHTSAEYAVSRSCRKQEPFLTEGTVRVVTRFFCPF